MPLKVLNQIKWLCKEIPKVEWSGVLFYSIEGSIKDPSNMVITLEDILPMHKGTSAYTEYTFDERVINHMMDTPGADDWKMGHIHSHNTMAVFFSGTDVSELQDNAPNHNFYLSLIVNNFMDFCAKVAFVVKGDSTQFKGRDENGQKYVYSTEEVAEEKLISYDCEIESPSETIEVSDSFSEKVEGIIKEAEKKVSTYTTTTYNIAANKSRIAPTNSRGSFVGKSNPGTDWGRASWDFDDELYPTEAYEKPERFFTGLLTEEEQEEIEDDEIQIFEDFTLSVLNVGNDASEFSDIEGLVEHYVSFHVSPINFASTIVKNYVKVYKNFFTFSKDKNQADFYIDVAEGVIEVLQKETELSTSHKVREMLRAVEKGLDNMIDKFKQYESDTV